MKGGVYWSGTMGADHTRRVEGGRPRCRGYGGTSAVGFRLQRRIAGGFLHMLMLHRRRRHMRLRRSCSFLRRRGRGRAAGPAVEADLVHGDVVDDGFVVGVVNDGYVGHVGDRAIVGKGITHPAPTRKADAHIAEAVVDAAIKPDVRTPIADV